MEIPADGIIPLQSDTQEDGDGQDIGVKVVEPTRKSTKMMKPFQKDGSKKMMKQCQKDGKKNPGPNIAYWLPWGKRKEREAEKSEEEIKSKFQDI